MLLTKEVEIKLNPNNIVYYKNFGYEGKFGQTITIPIEHLSHGSHIDVNILCDYCKKEVVKRPYREYLRALKSLNKFSCSNCNGEKKKESNMLKYGVTSTAKLKETQDKYKENCYKKYGVENISLIPEVQNKREKSCIERFGVNNPFKSVEIQEKIKASCFSHFGVEYPAQSPEIRAKMAQTLYKNGTIPTSKQQFHIFNLYQSVKPSIQLNYPISQYNADICLLDEKIDIEIDFGGHNLQVKLGQLTQEEFDHKELIRDKVIKSEGYKIIRIISSTDRLPQDDILLQMLQEARQYFSNYPEHSWIEFNISDSTLRNAEHKQGIHYSFGKLRTIKDSDIASKESVS